MDKTIFQKIIDREVAANIEYEDDQVIVFHDIHPSAPVHVLIVPKKLIVKLSDIADGDLGLMGHIQIIASQMVVKLGISDAFKLIINGGKLQEVPHMHYHLLGGFK